MSCPNIHSDGAGRIVSPTPALKRKLPPIPVTAEPTKKGYDLTSVWPEPTPTGYISVPPDALSLTCNIELANGGGCATPANIMLSRTSVFPQPPDPPGGGF